ncbi:MAG: HmuY family protein [Gemmatimonadota bacterium]
MLNGGAGDARADDAPSVPPAGDRAPDAPVPRALKLAGVAAVLGIVLLVRMSLQRPEPPWFVPSPIALRPAAEHVVGPELVTVDARDASQWRYFSFARGSAIERPDLHGWDLAFRRFQIMANGGAGFTGQAGIVDLGEVSFEGVDAAPTAGYVATTARGDSMNAAIERWYEYSFTSHLLSPKPRVYAIRTADGRYAKLEFVGYYCAGASPGCVTFRYVYQGAGGASFGGRADDGGDSG